MLQALGAHLAQCRWKGQREWSAGQGPPGFPQRASLTNCGPGLRAAPWKAILVTWPTVGLSFPICKMDLSECRHSLTHGLAAEVRDESKALVAATEPVEGESRPGTVWIPAWLFVNHNFR